MAGLSSNVMVRASLTPVGSRKQPYYMQYRTLEIGTGPDTNLNLRFLLVHWFLDRQA